MKKKLLVVCGGQSSEHSISRISCNSVMKHLDKDKYEITLVGIAKDGKWYILSGRRCIQSSEKSGCCIPGTSRTLRRRWNHPGII